MSTRTFHLTEHFDGFIAAGVQAGRYSDASEAVQAGLRLLEQQEQEDKAKTNGSGARSRKALRPWIAAKASR